MVRRTFWLIQGQNQRKATEAGLDEGGNPHPEQREREEHEEESDMEEDFDLDSIIAGLEENTEYEEYGKAAALLCLGWDALTPLNIIFDGLNKVHKANYNADNCRIVHFRNTDETKIFVQEQNGIDIYAFRSVANRDFKFLNITGEKIYKVATIFHRLDGKPITEADTAAAVQSVAHRYPDFRPFIKTHPGWSDRFVSVNVEHPKIEEIRNLMEQHRGYQNGRSNLEMFKGGVVVGYVYLQTFWTNDKDWKQYVVGPIGTGRDFRAQHELGMLKLGGREAIGYASKISIIQRIPQQTYNVWLTDTGLKRFRMLEEKEKSFAMGKDKKKLVVTVRQWEKREAKKDGDDAADKRTPFQKAHKYGEAHRN